MNVLEHGRNLSFWLIDRVRGGYVRQYLYDLQKYCGVNADSIEIKEHQQEALIELLDKTAKNVPYYSEMNSNDLSDWPVITKATIKENQSSFLSKTYKKDDLYRMSTSGSTGTPFVSLQNFEKKKRVNAETLYYLGLQGYKVGQRIIFLRSVVDECKKSNVEQFCQNIYQINCNDLSDDGIVGILTEIERLSRRCGAILIAYSSTYEALRKYFEQNGYDKARKCKIMSLTAGSEMLYDVTRKAMERAFNCKCYSRYANEENGFLGQDGIENNVFLINESDYIIEILKFDSDEPAELGERGRIIVMDLYNHAQPMIRYDTGDVGAFVEVNDGNKKRKAIGNFGGRSVDMVTDEKGNLVSPHSVTNMMWKYQMIKQFQFIQKGFGVYKIIINADWKIDNEESILKELKELFGQNAKVEIEYCDDIPVLASGKRRYIVNEMLMKR